MEVTNVVEENVVPVKVSAPEPRAKRDRKKTEVFVVEVSSKETKEFTVPAGKGCTLGSVAAFEDAVAKVRGDDDVLKTVHALCFGVPGTKLNRKKNMRQFCGFAPDADKMAVENKLIDNKKKWTVSFLKEACGLLSLERSGSREELCKRVVDYLAMPTERSGSRAPKKTKGAKRKRTTKSGEPKAKRAPSAFLLFSQANRELAKSENPGASFGDIGKVLGVMWGGLSASEKQTWLDAAAAGAQNGNETESSADDGEEEESPAAETPAVEEPTEDSA